MRFSKEVKVALLAIVSIAALYFGFWFLKGSNLFSGSYTYYVYYNDVEGLDVSNPVILNGVNVGLVKKLAIEPSHNNRIQVTLEIDKDLEVGDSTEAHLINSSLLGGKAIELKMGKNTTRYTGGETLIAVRAQAITDVLASKGTQLVDRIDSTILVVNSIFDERTVKSIKGAIENTEATTLALQKLMEGNQRNISQITSNLSSLTASLRSTQQKFDRLASNLNEITDTLKQAEIKAMVDNLNQTVLEAQAAMAKLNQSEGSLGKLMNDDSLYANLNQSAASLDALLKDIQAHPKRYVHFSLIGRRDKYKIDKAGRVIEADKVKEAEKVERAGVVE